MSLYALIGLMAPVLFLYAYAMVSLGRWPSTAMKFHVLNLLGAVFILISLLEQWNLSVFVLEVCWSSISLYGMWKGSKAA